MCRCSALLRRVLKPESWICFLLPFLHLLLLLLVFLFHLHLLILHLLVFLLFLLSSHYHLLILPFLLLYSIHLSSSFINNSTYHSEGSALVIFPVLSRRERALGNILILRKEKKDKNTKTKNIHI